MSLVVPHSIAQGEESHALEGESRSTEASFSGPPAIVNYALREMT